MNGTPIPEPARFVIAVVAGFAVMFVVNAVAAVAVIDPLFGDDYPEVVPDDVGLELPLLATGYAVIALALAWFHHRDRSLDWRRRGIGIGLAVGLAAFGCVHLVQAGYTTIDDTAWILSGLGDVAGPVAGSLTIAYLTRRPHASPAPMSRIDADLDRLGDHPEELRADIARLEAVAVSIDHHLTRLRRATVDEPPTR